MQAPNWYSPTDQNIFQDNQFITQEPYRLNEYEAQNIGGGGGGGGGGDVRLPSSFQSTPLGYYGEEGTVGLPGNITQRGPGRQLDQFEYKGKMYDDPLAPASLMDEEEEDPGFFKQLKEGFMDNPLMQGVMTVANPFMAGAKTILEGIGQVLPVNERAILENEALGSGVALDNIGRIVRQEGIDYDDAANIFAGYNYAQIDEDTFEKRRKSIQNMSPDAYKKRLKAINAFEKKWRESKIKTSYIVDQKMRAKGKTPLPDQIAINKAKQDFQNIVSQAEDAPKTVVDTAASEDIISTPPAAPISAPVPAHIIGSGGTNYQGGGQGPPSEGGAPTGTAGRNPWGRAKGGLIRKKYGNGGIVDLL